MDEAKRCEGQEAKPETRLIGSGILFPNSMKKTDQGFTISPIDQNIINSAVIYWDKLACPTTNIVKMAIKGEDLLIKEGLLIRPMAVLHGTIRGGGIYDFEMHAQALQFAELEKKDPGFWAIADGSPEKLADLSTSQAARTALVKLTGVLPLPPDGTNIEAILEFKSKRAAELKRLRSALDRMYIEISQSADIEATTKYYVKEVDQAVSDTLKVSKEWWKLIKVADIRSLVSLGGPIAGAALGYTVNMPGATAILGGAGSVIGIANGVSAKIKSDRKLPFWYAVQVRNMAK